MEMPAVNFDFFSVNEAAEYLGVTTGRIRQLLMRQQIAGHKVGERAWAIPRAELDRRKREISDVPATTERETGNS